MIHYHGGPVTPETCAVRLWTARHAFISFANPQQIQVAAAVTQSFALDNGAFTFWKTGRTVAWTDYYEWCERWLRHPACDWAVIPDVIEGTEEENDALVDDWPFGVRGVPVWHLNESVGRLRRLAKAWPVVALGSAAEYDVRRPSRCIERVQRVMPAIQDSMGLITKLHGLRMLNPKITQKLPLSSADSTNVARNIGIDRKWNGGYAPSTKEARVDVLVQRIEGTPNRVPGVHG